MQLHDWRLQLRRECIVDPQQAIFRVLKYSASAFPVWLGCDLSLPNILSSMLH